MYKCCANKDGTCRNVMLYGIKCDGYKQKCVLRDKYEVLENVERSCQRIVRKAFGVEDEK